MPSEIPVLMYHSVSDGDGPTCIPLRTFREQMNVIDRQGYRVISLADLVSWHRGESELASRAVVLTFDDGFADFIESAFPELKKRGWTATVFIPTSLIGSKGSWTGAARPPLRLLNWRQVEQLAEEGIDFGAHTMTHCDLTRLTPDEARREICESQQTIQQRLNGRGGNSFAPPYGRCTDALRIEIQNCYKISVGVELHRASRLSDLYDIPRLEMHYFRNIRLWDAFLDDRAEWYLRGRRILRSLRRVL